MYPRAWGAAPLISLSDDLAHHACFNWLVKRRFVADEHVPVRGFRSLIDEIVHNRAARFERQRQDIGSAALTFCQANHTITPVDVVQLQMDNFAGSKTKVHQTAHHGIAALGRWNRGIK